MRQQRTAQLDLEGAVAKVLQALPTAGLRLPRGAISAEESGVDEALLELIEPLLLADVRRELLHVLQYL